MTAPLKITLLKFFVTNLNYYGLLALDWRFAKVYGQK